eukprot:3465156-Rhodomonas_salina.1
MSASSPSFAVFLRWRQAAAVCARRVAAAGCQEADARQRSAAHVALLSTTHAASLRCDGC